MLGPEACRNVALFLPHGVGINGCGRELGMAQPALDQVEGNPFFDTGDAKPMPQPFRRRLRAGDGGLGHHLNDPSIGGFQAPGPEPGPRLTVAEAMHEIERIQEGGRHGHRTVDTGAAFLLALKGEDSGPKIDPIRD